jgi:hypothetical protein
MRSSLLVLIPLFVACGASIDPAMRADVDRQVATLQPRATTYPAPTSTEPMPLAPGQWVKLKLVDKQSRPSFMTYKVVGQEGDAHWIEVKTEQYSGKTVLKMLLALGDRTDVNKVEIRRLIVKQGDRAPMDYQSPMLDIVKGTYKSVARGLVVDWKSLPRETKTAPAGTFEDSFTPPCPSRVSFTRTARTARRSTSSTSAPPARRRSSDARSRAREREKKGRGPAASAGTAGALRS